MKKLILLLLGVLICLSLYSSLQNKGNTKYVKINIGHSLNFSNKEIQSAADSVLKKFEEFKGCQLTELWYDENISTAEVDSYLSTGRGSVNGVKQENIIVLLSNFDTNSFASNEGFNPNSTYTNWSWILIRDNKTGNWIVDNWGY